ncbi:hypothetical protein BW735_17280 [Escherichia coli]|nr:hypothetical protein AWP82_08500 [Escherichia coli]OLR81287.1 hypothetical protein BUE81_28220 [Escherichia coli]OUJ88914.1 hypothetical protein BW735_17280 [Escherichia coli]OYG91804.1 hypothetical protein CI726_27080 [Shigella sonnei]PLK14563.1 hypothetical protein B7L63_03290 [Escherichia coli]
MILSILRAVRGCVEIRASHYKYQDLASHSRGFLLPLQKHFLQSGFDNGLYPTRDNLTDIPFKG